MGIPLLERHAEEISGVLSCYDRIIITGTVPGICYAGGMTGVLYARGVRIFDFEAFAKPLGLAVEANAKRLAEQAGLAIEYIPSAKKLVLSLSKHSGRKTGLPKSCNSVATCRVLCISSPRWRVATATDRGTTKPATRPICARVPASTRTTTFISSWLSFNTFVSQPSSPT